MLLTRLADRTRAAGNARTATRFETDARRAQDESYAIRRAIAALDDGLNADAVNGERLGS
jgi:hypothetical protein